MLQQTYLPIQLALDQRWQPPADTPSTLPQLHLELHLTGREATEIQELVHRSITRLLTTPALIKL
jgi:hypothetical protein